MITKLNKNNFFFFKYKNKMLQNNVQKKNIILKLCLIQGKLVSVLDDNTLHLWSIENVEKKSSNQQLKWKKSCTLPGRPGLVFIGINYQRLNS